VTGKTVDLLETIGILSELKNVGIYGIKNDILKPHEGLNINI